MILFQTFQSFDLVGGAFVSIIFHSMIGDVILAFSVTSGVLSMCFRASVSDMKPRLGVDALDEKLDVFGR